MSVGKIGQFDLLKDNWNIYVDRLEQYFIANTVKSEVKVATLITVIGNDAYELMVSLCTPEKPASKTYTELVTLMKNHLNPKPSQLAERFKFRQRIQKSEESIAIYVTELKKLSKDCGFSAENLKENLRDQFVCGLVSDDIRQKLFTEDDTITFERAYKLAVSMEAAEKNAALVEGCTRGKSGNGTADTAESVTSVHHVGRTNSGGGKQRPAGSAGGRQSYSVAKGARNYRSSNSAGGSESSRQYRGSHNDSCMMECKACGGKHSWDSCKFKAYVCRVCNQDGHLKKMCPKMSFSRISNLQENVSISKDDSDSDEVMIIDFNSLSISQCKPIIISVCIQGKTIEMECDTGSAISCISYELYKSNFSQLAIKPCKLILKYYTGELVRPVGMIKPSVMYKGKERVLDLYIIDKGNTALLGRQWLADLGVFVLPLHHNNCKEIEFNLKELSSRYCDVFAEGLGRFTGGAVSIHLREGARPVFMRARPLAYALREPVERALDQLVRDGILTAVDRSDWATPIVPVVKKDGTAQKLNALVGDAFRMAFASQLQPSAPLWSQELGAGGERGMGPRAPDSLPGLARRYPACLSPPKCDTGASKLVSEPSPSSSEESNSPTEVSCYRRLGERAPLMRRLARAGLGAGLLLDDDDSTPLVADTPTTPTNVSLCLNGGYINEESEAEARTRDSNREPPAPRARGAPPVPPAPLPASLPPCIPPAPPSPAPPPPPTGSQSAHATPTRRVQTPRHRNHDAHARNCNDLDNCGPLASAATWSSSGSSCGAAGCTRNVNNNPRPEPELRHAPWFQQGIPREIALEVLGAQGVGAFLVRGSTTQPACFALSLRVPRDFAPSGIAHYLILRTPKGYKIKGFTKEFSSLSALVTHHSVMPELLPVPLRLPRAPGGPRASGRGGDHTDIDSLAPPKGAPAAHCTPHRVTNFRTQLDV